MIEVRRITEYDYEELKEAISKDPYHRDTTTPEFFYEEGFCNVYFDEAGTILWLRGCTDVNRVIRLDIQFRRNRDALRNKAAMDQGFPELCERAKSNNFKAFVFHSTSPHLIRYCCEHLGFTEENNILRKDL
jgi:hypothetical protein